MPDSRTGGFYACVCVLVAVVDLVSASSSSTSWDGPPGSLPQSRREAARGNAVLVDDVAAAVQRRDGRVDLRCTARFVALAGHRVAVLVSGSVLGWRR